MEMQRIYLELQPLHEQGRMKSLKSTEQGYLKCHSNMHSIVQNWYKAHTHEFETYPPSPTAIIATPKIVQRVCAINFALQGIKKDLCDHVEQSYWLTAPRLRWLSMGQCLRLNALEYYPEEMDVVCPLLFPGARRWLIEQEKSLEELEAEEKEEEESDDTEEEGEEKEGEGKDGEGKRKTVSRSSHKQRKRKEGNKQNNKEEEEEEDDEDDDGPAAVVSSQYFRNLMQEVHVLSPSSLCGFGTIHSHHNPNSAFHFTQPVHLYTQETKKSKNTTSSTTSSRRPRPLPVWLNEAEVQMRISLLERITLTYEACAIYHGNNLMDDAQHSFYTWLFQQSSQTIETAMKIMHTHDVEQMLRIVL